MKNKYSNEDIRRFCQYFHSRPNNTYIQYAIDTKPSNMSDIEYSIQIDSIRKKLQRDYILVSIKANDSSGLFYSSKTIDINKLYRKYCISI